MRKRQTIIIPVILAHSAAGSILAGSTDAEPKPTRQAAVLRATPTGMGATLISRTRTPPSARRSAATDRSPLDLVGVTTGHHGCGKSPAWRAHHYRDLRRRRSMTEGWRSLCGFRTIERP
jgi:hypothetical protein